MLDVSRVFKFKNMDVFIVNNLIKYYGMKFKNEEEKEKYFENAKAINIWYNKSIA